MSFFDWNGDGKKDFADSFIEYQIYKDTTGNSNTSRHSSSDNSGFFGCVSYIVCCFISMVLLNFLKTNRWIFPASAAIVIAVAIIRMIIKRVGYNKAIKIFNKGEYAIAAKIFEKLGSCKNSRTYYRISYLHLLYDKTKGFTDYASESFAHDLDSAQKMFACVSLSYHEQFERVKEIGENLQIYRHNYESYCEQKFLAELSGKLPYEGLDVKYINKTVLGDYLEVKTLSSPDLYLRHYDVYRKMRDVDPKVESAECYVFSGPDGKGDYVYAYKGKVCSVKENNGKNSEV